MKDAFIWKQIEKSFVEGATSRFLRRLIVHCVDHAAAVHYGMERAMKCAQIHEAVVFCLERFGIKGRLYAGAVCTLEVFEDPNYVGWGGFWGADHHFWAVSEFREIVDISISYSHFHPSRSRTDGIGLPPIWWGSDYWPAVIKYLPDGPGRLDFDGKDADDLNVFRNVVSRTLDRALMGSVEDIPSLPILTGIPSMEELEAKGHPWLVRARAHQDTPPPPWVRAREAELLNAYYAGTTAPNCLPEVIR